MYWRPIIADPAEGGLPLAGGPLSFALVERLSRDGSSAVQPATQIPDNVLDRLTAPRLPLAGLDLDRPVLMGILNVTPDSFSDGGQHNAQDAAIERGRQMSAEGADLIDIGGESTRPGAETVKNAEEIARTVPVIRALAAEGHVISIDTRKADVARAAITAGASLFNDVSALTYDADSLQVASETGVALCLMHASGDPETMQKNPRYDNVLLDVYDYLEARLQVAESVGISRSRVLVDPGIGFGKTLEHNLALLTGLSLFHGLGAPVLLGASRKRFIGTLSGEVDAARRAPGSIAVALRGIQQGVQMLRIHDVRETRAAVDVWTAMNVGSHRHT